MVSRAMPWIEGRKGMPLVIDGRVYYRTAEACRKVGVCRNTLFRWSKDGKLGGSEYRDRKGWRLFTQEQLEFLKRPTEPPNSHPQTSGRAVQ